VFLGSHQHTLDAKGRVILPAKYRDRLAGGLVFVPGQDRCIDVYPQAAFEERVRNLRALPRERQRARKYLRVVLGSAEQVVPDGQGRVTVPPDLRTYAGLDRDLVIAGADEKMEIWDRARYEEWQSEARDEFANLDEEFVF
jgi:MraZ protein